MIEKLLKHCFNGYLAEGWDRVVFDFDSAWNLPFNGRWNLNSSIFYFANEQFRRMETPHHCLPKKDVPRLNYNQYFDMKLAAFCFVFEKFTKSFQQESEWVAKRLVIDSIYFSLASSLWGLLMGKKCGSLEWRRKSFFKAIIFHSGTSLFPLFCFRFRWCIRTSTQRIRGKMYQVFTRNCLCCAFCDTCSVNFSGENQSQLLPDFTTEAKPRSLESKQQKGFFTPCMLLWYSQLDVAVFSYLPCHLQLL